MTKRGAQILLSGKQFSIMKDSKVVGESATKGNVLSIEGAKSETAQVALSEKSMKLWHGGFGHVKVQSLKKAASSEAVLTLLFTLWAGVFQRYAKSPPRSVRVLRNHFLKKLKISIFTVRFVITAWFKE